MIGTESARVSESFSGPFYDMMQMSTQKTKRIHMKKKPKQQDDRYLKQLRPLERRKQETIRRRVMSDTLDYLYAVRS